MNVIPTNSTHQTVKGSEAKNTPLASLDLQKFAEQLTIAQKDVDWIEKEASVIERERLNRELSQEKIELDEQDQKLMDESVAFAFMQKVKETNRLEGQKNMRNLAETRQMGTDFLKGFKSKNQARIEQTDNLRFENLQRAKNESMIGQESFETAINDTKNRSHLEAIEQKTLQRKSHLINPAVNQEEAAETVQAATGDAKLKESDAKLKTNQPMMGNQETDNGAVPPAKGQNLNSSMDLSRGTTQHKTVSQEKAALKVDGAQTHQNDSKIGSIKASSTGETQNMNLKANAKVGAMEGGTGQARPQESSSTLNKAQEAKPTQKQPSASRSEQAQNIKTMMGNIKLLLSKNRDEMTMKLNPEHLGKLEIKLKKEADVMTGVLKVESLEAKEAIEAQLANLKQGLEDQGIKVDQFLVHLDQQDQGAASGFSLNQGDSQPQETQAGSSNDRTGSEDPLEASQTEAPRASQSQDTDDGLNIYA